MKAKATREAGQAPSQKENFSGHEKLDNFFTEHPELQLTLNVPTEVVQFLFPDALKNISGGSSSLALKVGTKKSDRYLDLMIVDESKKADKRALKEAFQFSTSYDTSDFLKPGESGSPIFFCQLGRLNGAPEVLVLASMDTHKDFRGKGVGSEFQQRLFELAKKLGFKTIVGEAINMQALNFDKKLGYTIVPKGETRERLENQGIYNPGEGGTPVIKQLV